MNIFNQFKDHIATIITQLVTDGKIHLTAEFPVFDVSPPREASHGDLATNIAMVLASKTGKKPREIADMVVSVLLGLKSVAKAEIAGPGFINITLKPSVWQHIIPSILKEGIAFGNSTMGAGKKINVEYVSANPTGPMHVGHGRGAVVGDALAMLLIKAGFSVTKEYYINDGGGQIDKLADSAFLRYREALGEDIGEMPEGMYPGEYMKAIGEGLAKKHERDLLQMERADWLPMVRKFAVDVNMATIREDLAVIGIKHDVFTSEQAVIDAGKVNEAIALLEGKGLLYTGVLEPPKGKPIPEDFEPKPQLLFKASQFGDDCDRAVKKSDGSWAYMTPDIAYHLDKYQRGFIDMILIVGADHAGYQKRIQAAVKALTDGIGAVEVKLCQLVKFMKGGEPLKMSKRAGTFVTVREVVDEVGRGVFRFIMLTRKNDAPLDFDFVKVMEQSKDNPVFYVQYAHARCKSVIRMANEDAADAVKQSEHPSKELVEKLSTPAELELIQVLANWPRIVEGAAQSYEPHRIAFYLQELAAAFHGYWNKGNEDASLRFILKDDLQMTTARLALVRSVATVIASGLWVLGVEPLEEMR
jgi:arginyl-tRNA synthetase